MIHVYKNDIPSDLDLGHSVAIDTETLGLNIFRDSLCLVQLSSGDGHAHLVKIEDPNDAINLRKLLADDSIRKLFHFARFDLAILNFTFGLHIKNIYCTKIASKIARTYTDKHSLKHLCKELLGIELNKEEQSSYWKAEKLTERQIAYAASDVWYLHAIKDKLDKILIEENRLHFAEQCFLALQNTIVPLETAHMDPEYIFSH